MPFFSSIPVWGWGDIVSTALVLVGVLSEWPWAIRKLSPEKANDLLPIALKREKLKKRLGIVLIIGVAGELCSLPFPIIESASLNKEAADTMSLAAKIGKTNAWLMQSNLVLQSKLQPRTINMIQVSNFIYLTENVPKDVAITVHASSQGDDTLSYAFQIRFLLDQAKFKRDSSQNGVKTDMTEPINGRMALTIVSRPAGKVFEWPIVMFICYGESNVTWLDREIYSFTNRVEWPIGGKAEPKKVYEAIDACFKRIGIRTMWMQSSTWLSPGEYEIYIPPKNN